MDMIFHLWNLPFLWQISLHHFCSKSRHAKHIRVDMKILAARHDGLPLQIIRPADSIDSSYFRDISGFAIIT